MSDPVLVTRRGSMTVLTLNRPDARNPLDQEMSGALLDEVRAAMADDTVRSVAIAAAGKAFSAGGDLRQMRHLAGSPAPEAHGWPGAIVDLHQLALQAPKPLLALVDGPAYAGGMGLAGICDVVLATPRASFALPEVRIGLFPMIVVAHLARSLPRKVLLEMMMTGQPLSVDDAHRLGFVARVCPDTDALLAEADRYAGWFADAAPDAIRLGRKAFAVLADLPAPQALDAAQLFNLAFFLGDELPEGAGAFLEKRRPAWADGDG
ncbi:MAG TPA: enoyl-CoA hydratase-related protein [Lapillicoccus sp.]|nr:enoyl-CoA hydratase-related protein [Lapillicoccus sp.]